MSSIADGQSVSVSINPGFILKVFGAARVSIDGSVTNVAGNRSFGEFSTQKTATITGVIGASFDLTPSMAQSVNLYGSLAALAADSAAKYPAGTVAYVGPDATGQYAEWFSNGVRWRPRGGIIAMKNTAGSVTDAGTSEQDAYSIVIPAGLIGPTDDWYIDHFWQWPNSATNKTVRVKFGGTTIASLTATTTVTGRGTTHIYMRDSKTAQIFSAASSALSFQEGQTSGTAPSTATVDTNSDITVNLTGQWGTAGAGSNLITLERVAIGVKFAY